MRIKRMTARFGKLNGDTLTLGTGLNVIIGANEGGKTTWSGFIRTMLYGINTDGLLHHGGLTDESRFTPWDGSPMEGEMVVTWGDDTLVLQRSQKEDNPFGGFAAYNERTGLEVPELFSLNCGESLVGASEEVFLRSAFIGHGGNLAVHSAPDLEHRMAALVSSGEEDVSYATVDETLGTWLRRRRHGENGQIPKLEKELEEARSNRERIGNNRETLNVLVKQEQKLGKKRSLLQEKLDIYLKMEQQEINRAFVKAKAELEETDSQHQALLRQREKFTTIPSTPHLLDLEDTLHDVQNMEPQIRQIEQAIRQVEDRLDDALARGEDDRFPNMSTEEAMRQISTDMEEVEELEHKIEKKLNGIWKSVAFATLASFGVVAGGVAVPEQQALFGLLGGVTFLGLSGIGIMGSISANRRREERLEETLEFYKVKHVQEMRDVGNRYSAIQDEIANLQSQVKQSYQGLEDMRHRQKETHKKFMEDVVKFAPEVSSAKEAGEAIARALRLEEQLKKAEDLLKERKKLYQDLLEKGGEETVSNEEFTAPDVSRTDLEREKSKIDVEYEEIDRELHLLLGQQETLGDIVALTAREEELKCELERRKKEYRALAIARKGLERAFESVQNRFYPELNRLAGDYFARMTGGRYQSLSLTRELDAFTNHDEDQRSAMALSQGTVDQIYLAVRLAVADLCLAKGELCPIILDDALVSFDQGRMENALDLLAEMGEHRQIILFSCHGREGKYMSHHPKAKVIAL